jgi:hypothetical protein
MIRNSTRTWRLSVPQPSSFFPSFSLPKREENLTLYEITPCMFISLCLPPFQTCLSFGTTHLSCCLLLSVVACPLSQGHSVISVLWPVLCLMATLLSQCCGLSPVSWPLCHHRSVTLFSTAAEICWSLYPSCIFWAVESSSRAVIIWEEGEPITGSSNCPVKISFFKNVLFFPFLHFFTLQKQTHTYERQLTDTYKQ